MKKCIFFIAVTVLPLQASSQVEDSIKSGSHQEALPSYPWSDESESVRVSKSLLSRFEIQSVTMSDFESRRFALSSLFIGTFRLTPLEVQNVTEAIARALDELRTIECRSFRPTDEPNRPQTDQLPSHEGDQRFSFELTSFRPEAAAVRARLEGEILGILGQQRGELFLEQGRQLWGEIRQFDPPESLPAGATTTIRHVFVLPRSAPGRVDRYRTSETLLDGGSSRGSEGWTHGVQLDKYLPEKLRPIVARWRKEAAQLPKGDAVQQSSPSVGPVHADPSSLGSSQQPATFEPWDDAAAHVDIPKTTVALLSIPGMTLDDQVAPEAAAFFGLANEEQKAIVDLYDEMKHRFEDLERRHFHHIGKTSFILEAFPLEADRIKHEWRNRLNSLVGANRGELLDGRIRVPVNPYWVPKSNRSSPRIPEEALHAAENGPAWLRRGTDSIRMQITRATHEGSGSWIKIEYASDHPEGGRGSVTARLDKIAKRWRHLLTPQALGLLPEL